MADGMNRKKLTTNDALTYITAIKDLFHDRKDKYDEFLEIMKGFKTQRIDTVGVIAKVKELFKGHRDLILGFNTFLPEGYKISLPPEEEIPRVRKPQFDEAFNFVNKVKSRFHENERAYKAFLDVLKMYRNREKSVAEVYQEVVALLFEHPDLLVEFTHYLPDKPAAVSLPNNLSGRSRTLHDDCGSPLRAGRLMHIGKDSRYDKGLRRDDREQRRCRERDKERIEENDLKEWEGDSKDSERDLTQPFPRKRSFSRMEDSIAHQLQQGMYSTELAFCETVKEKCDSDAYEELLNGLHNYSQEIITRLQYRNLVDDLLGAYPDLVEQLNDFLKDHKNIDGLLAVAGLLSKRGPLQNAGKFSRPLNVDYRERDEDNYRRYRERDRSEKGVALSSKDIINHRTSFLSSKDKYITKPIQELDLSNCEQCTPSYRLLPMDYPLPSTSHRTGIGAEILNDHWVSVTSGSEDYSFKHMRKNQYEESLFRCEDDRFELDLLLESVNGTVVQAEELLNKIINNIVKAESPITVENYLTARSIRCIERIYSDHGLDVMDLLRKNAPHALPIILSRLKQKNEEWDRCRADFDKIWAEIYAKNYQKSLDHRSFYFKQQDTRSLSTKALLADIKELKESMCGEDDALCAFITGNGKEIVNHLKYEYPDTGIHEDLYKLVQYSCKEAVPEELDELMKIWTNVLEPMFGMPCRAKGIEDAKDIVKAINHFPKGADETSVGGKTSITTKESNPSGDDDESPPPKELTSAGSSLMDGGLNPDHFTTGYCASPKCADEAADGVLKTRGTDERFSSLEIGDTQRPVMPSNGATLENTRAGKSRELSSSHFKTEKEEGELSPDRNDDDDEKFAAYGDDDVDPTQILKAGGEDAGDEGESTAQKDSRSASENGDMSRNESVNVEDCFHEELEENEQENVVKAESKAKARKVDDSDEVEGDIRFNLLSERTIDLTTTVKPLAEHVPATSHGIEKDNRVFYASDSFYVLFRLHRMLYERILSAKATASSAETKYTRFMNALYRLLHGSIDNTQYEDDCLDAIGTHSYTLFTLDKLLYKLVKQLQAIAADETDREIIELYAYEKSRGPGRFSDRVYHANARFLLYDENIYRFESSSAPNQLSIRLLEHDQDKPAGGVILKDFLDDVLAPSLDEMKGSDVLLKRNKRKYEYGDEGTCQAMEGLLMLNGLLLRLSCSSYKVSYILDTEDFMFRPKSRRRALCRNASSAGQTSSSNNFHRRKRAKLSHQF